MIRDRLFTESPYAGFDASPYPVDFVEETLPVFAQAIDHLKPARIIEVGTWKGGSAIHMARLCAERNLPTEIVCVDTWLGSYEHWMLEDERWGKQNLARKHGYPHLYYQFLANVVNSGHAERITPLPISSMNGAILLGKLGITADLIYVDAAHDYRSVLDDLIMFWGILRPGGVLIGDDYHGGGPGVVQAANEFAKGVGLQLQASDGKFVLVKPM